MANVFSSRGRFYHLPSRIQSPCHDLELDKNFLFKDFFNHFLLFYSLLFEMGRGGKERMRLGF